MTTEAGLDGLLSKGLKHEEEIARINRDQFALARRFNKECHRLLFDTNVHNEDLQEMLVATLFLRALHHYQAAIVLLEKGFVAAGKAAIRAELEAVFAVRAVAANDDNVRAYVNDDDIRRRRQLVNARDHDYPVFAQLRKANLEDKIVELDERVAKAKPLSTAQLSKMAELHQLYVSVYSFLSTDVHSSVRALDASLVRGPDGKINEIDYLPSLDETGDLLLTAADFILLGSDAVVRQFEVDFVAKRKELAAELEAGVALSAAARD